MSSQSNNHSASRIVPNEWPLRFKEHNFEALCYNAIGCNVAYNGHYQKKSEPDEVSPPPPSPDYLNKVWGSVEVGIRNFPPPANVRWKSMDGIPHEAKVDIAGIFENELILHKVSRDEVPDGWAHNVVPNVFLEVNDRTINVYMRAHIATKQLQDPGNSHSNFRNDLMLAWTHTY